jgi:AcrR family transcriptional regulator
MTANGDDVNLLVGRQAAYRARTRASLIKSAHRVLAEVGLGTTIDDLAIQAQVSPATIYNHFHSKEEYLKEALEQLWREWILWAYDGRPFARDIETMIDVCRKMYRLDPSNTLIGRVLSKTLRDSTFVIEALKDSSTAGFKEAAHRAGLDSDDFDTRLEMWAHCLVGIFQGVFVTKKMSHEEADRALRVALSIWSLNKTQAEKLTAKPLEFKK